MLPDATAFRGLFRRKTSIPLAAVILVITLTLMLQADRMATAKGEKKSAVKERFGWFPRIDPEKLAVKKGVYFIKGLRGCQQTTDYTCGPAVLMEISRYYRIGGIKPDASTEMRIAREAGTRSFEVLKKGGKPGTTPDEMKRWLETHGFRARLTYEDRGDGSALENLKDNIMKGIPSIVEWSDLGGHWVIAVGYDTRDNDDPWDDVLIFADSFDRYDDYRDGYTFANANRFYWSWYDALYFGKVTWRTMITVEPAYDKSRK
jgi:hypothetical protein